MECSYKCLNVLGGWSVHINASSVETQRDCSDSQVFVCFSFFTHIKGCFWKYNGLAALMAMTIMLALALKSPTPRDQSPSLAS